MPEPVELVARPVLPSARPVTLDAGGRLPFLAGIGFTVILFVSQQSFVPELASLRLALAAAVVGLFTYVLDRLGNRRPLTIATRYASGEETFFGGCGSSCQDERFRGPSNEGLCHRRYWQLPVDTDSSALGLAERAAEVRERLRSTVRSHLMSDGPVGLFLYVGLDSSGLAALMAPMVKERFARSPSASRSAA